MQTCKYFLFFYDDLFIYYLGSLPSGPGVPENITVTFLNPTTVRVSWATSVENVDKFDVTYKPTDARYVLCNTVNINLLVVWILILNGANDFITVCSNSWLLLKLLVGQKILPDFLYY